MDGYHNNPMYDDDLPIGKAIIIGILILVVIYLLKRSEDLDNWFDEDICDDGFCFT